MRRILLALTLVSAASAVELRWHASPDKGASPVGVVRLWMDQAVTSVRVERADGVPVGAQILWSATGQPTDVWFDASAGGPVTIIAGGTGSPAWQPRQGMMLETRRRAEGSIETWEDFQALWKASTPQGRGVVPHVFDGLNRFGPIEDFCSFYDGWLRIETAGDYTFATISDDGSWLLIDGQMVAKWPGWHGPEHGLRGKFSGTVRLTPGAHHFQYGHVQGSGGTVAEAAWKQPGDAKLMVIPPEAFGLISRYVVDQVDGAVDVFSWEAEGHSRIDDQALVTLRISSLTGKTAGKPVAGTASAGGEAIAWTAADGRVVLPPGDWRLTSGTCSRTLHVMPVWTQAEDWNEARWAAQRRVLLDGRDHAPLTLLHAGLRLAKLAEDSELGSRLADTICQRLAQHQLTLLADSGEQLDWIALRLQEPDVRRYADSAALFTAAIATSGLAPTAVDHLRLHLAGLRIHAFADGAAAEILLAAIDRQRLNDNDRRLAALYAADARLALGDVAGCRSRLAAIGDVVDLADTGYALHRRVRLEQARDQLSRGEFDAAEQPLREIEWETPRERLGTETGLLLAQVWMGRHEWPFALTRLRFLVSAAPTDPRAPDVLLMLVKAQRAAGDRDGARTTAATLRTQHPYSEATARLADVHLEGP